MSFAGFLDIARKDVNIAQNASQELFVRKHADYINNFVRNKSSYEFIMTEPFRLSGIYWCVGAMDIMGKLDSMARDEILAYVHDCQREDGGIPCNLDSVNVTFWIMKIFDALDEFDGVKIADYVKSLQNDDGSFGGDISNEIDTRFSMCALATLYLLNKLDSFDSQPAVNYVLSCYNFDGGFGTRPGSESHAGQIYCCLGSLCITNNLDQIDRHRTAEWLAQRQCASGGLNGRPEKLPDVCYSWWVLASLAIIKCLNWIDEELLKKFIYACQDDETGGFADRPGDMPDPFHTIFGLAGLSLFGREELAPVDAVLCMSKRCLKEKSLR